MLQKTMALRTLRLCVENQPVVYKLLSGKKATIPTVQHFFHAFQ